MSYKANIASNLINQLLRLVLGLATSILVARALGPEGQGYVAYIVLIFTLIGSYGHFGLNNAVMYFHKRKGIDASHLYHVNSTCLFIIFIALSGLTLGAWHSGLWLRDYALVWVLGGLLFVLAEFYYNNHYAWFIASERIRESNRVNLLVLVLKSLFVMAFWLLGTLGTGHWFWITVLALCLNAILLQIRLKRGFGFKWDTSLLKDEFAYGGIVFLAAAFDHLHLRVDQLFIKNMLGIPQLGVYSMAVNLSELMFLIPLSINTALTGRLYNSEEGDSGRMVTARTLKLTLYVCIILSIIGIPLSFAIPWIYGEGFRGAILPTMILLVGVIFASIARVAAPYFFTSGRPKVHLRVTLLSLLLNCLLNWLLIPLWGIRGAAIASAISYFFYGIYYLSVLVVKEKFQLRDFLRLRMSDINAVLRKP